jgi:hypothetical protein
VWGGSLASDFEERGGRRFATEAGLGCTSYGSNLTFQRLTVIYFGLSVAVGNPH